MARSRNIKPAFFDNYELADAGPYAQLLFIGLWCLADRDGKLEDRPRFIKAKLFPYYDIDINGYLTVIERLKFVERYEVNGLKVIKIVNFLKHQNPHNTEKKSELPDKPDMQEDLSSKNHLESCSYKNNGELTVKQPLLNGECTADSLLLIPDSLLLIPDSRAEKKSKQKFTQPTVEEVNDYILEKNYSVNAGAFVNFYASKDWMIGKNKMKCWRSAVNTWQQKEAKNDRQSIINSLNF